MGMDRKEPALWHSISLTTDHEREVGMDRKEPALWHSMSPATDGDSWFYIIFIFHHATNISIFIKFAQQDYS